MMKLRSALVAAGVLAVPAAAMAQPVDGLYVGAGAGYNYMQNQKVKTDNSGSLKANGGVVGLGSVGYGFGNGFRVEAEFDYRNTHQGSDGVKVFNQSYGGFVNGLFDFDIGQPFAYPYIGVGVGYVEQDLAHGQLLHGETFGSSTGSAAGQGIVGVAFPIPDAPGLSVTAEYRFMATFNSSNFNGSPTSVKLGPQYNNSGLLGLRYVFGIAPPPPPAPAPAPVAAPAPAPARTYLVFFDWDKADLTARAKQIIAQAAENASRVKLTRIEVSGYTDRSGTAAYNLKLSQRRARFRRRRAGSPRRAEVRDQRVRLRRDAPAGADRRRCARAAEPPCRDRAEVTTDAGRSRGRLRTARLTKTGRAPAMVPALRVWAAAEATATSYRQPQPS